MTSSLVLPPPGCLSYRQPTSYLSVVSSDGMATLPFPLPPPSFGPQSSGGRCLAPSFGPGGRCLAPSFGPQSGGGRCLAGRCRLIS